MTKPEVRSITELACVLAVILTLTCGAVAWLSPNVGLGLFGVWLLGVSAIAFFAWRWVKMILQRLAAIEDQLRSARMGQADYQITLNDEGVFSALHNELFHYARQTEALREDLQRDRDQLTVAITDIAHQLRTPIATATNLSELLTAANAAATREELMVQNRRLAQLVEQLILLAKVDTHTLSQRRAPISLDDLLRASLAPLLPVVADRRVTMKWQVAPDLTVTVNQRLMQEALINLFKNTFEHAPADSRVTVTAAATAISTVVTITNEGPAIPEADLPHLFERFYRGSQSAPNNLGIGLAIAQGIIAAGDGRLTVGNEAPGVSMRVEWFR